MKESIENLLRQADRTVSSCVVSDAAQLACRVVQLHRRRRRRRTAGAAVLVLLCCGLIAAVTVHSVASKPSHNQLVRTDQPEITTIRAQIDATEATIRRLEAAERQAANDRRLAELAKLPTPADNAERAAAVMVAQADRVAKTPGMIDAALKAYNNVIEYLPETRSANLARQRVAELRNEG